MKIAATYENGQIFQHFGHTEQFKIYKVEDGRITDASVVDTNGQGHGALADFLKDQDVNVLICGGIGGGAQEALGKQGIELCGGVTGDADQALVNYLAGTLTYNPDVKCDHHDEGDHQCGEHGHSCGQ